MTRDLPPDAPAPADDMTAPQLHRVAPLDPQTAAMIDTHLRAIDTVHIRVLGTDVAAAEPVEAYLLAKGLAVEVSLSDHMIPPPRHRYVFRYQGRMAILTIAPDLP